MLYAVYDRATDRWYKRGSWGDPGKKNNLWRQRGPLKLSLINYVDMHEKDYDIPRKYMVESNIHDENPDLDWRKAREETNKRRVCMLPYEVHEYTKDGTILIGTIKDWY